MKNRLKSACIVLTLTLGAGPVHAACYADYRAMMDNPLRLHYGVAELPDSACSRQAARQAVARRIAQGGWELVQVISVFDAAGLAARRSDAGAFFLRY